MREEKSASSRTTSSKAKWKLNPGEVDDTTVKDLKGFKGAQYTREDPAYKAVLAKCGKGSNDTFSGMTHPTLTPKPNTTYEEPKEWSRGKASEKR